LVYLYKDGTLFFSQDLASLAAVIPAMDQLTSSLNYATKRPYHPAILAAMKLACKKMDQYYSLMDSSSAYCIAMILHPSMKLEYFCKQRWLKTWIETAQELVQDEYHQEKPPLHKPDNF
jgi:hypothetical protein